MRKLFVAGTVATLFMLSACGGGSGNGGGVSTEATPTSKGYISSIVLPKSDASNAYIKIDGKTYSLDNGVIGISGYSKGLNRLDFESSMSSNGKNYQQSHTGKAYLYKQNYSVVLGADDQYVYTSSADGNKKEPGEGFTIDLLQGKQTSIEALPTKGRYTYNGGAFHKDEEGKLTYTADFDTMRGSGSITGMPTFGKVTLKSAEITQVEDQEEDFKGVGVEDGVAVAEKVGSGTYDLYFFGPKAEEIVGVTTLTRPGDPKLETEEQEFEIGIAGKR
ncbi:factor H binding protein domain-containing protein [Neisseria sp. S1]|uniref:factor H binding protein domain-containing protein n=1 Tax=Neisseria sp. S1 TaxID=3318354 RepID=UPI003A87E3DE